MNNRNAIYGTRLWQQINISKNAFGEIPTYGWPKTGFASMFLPDLNFDSELSVVFNENGVPESFLFFNWPMKFLEIDAETLYFEGNSENWEVVYGLGSRTPKAIINKKTGKQCKV